MANVELSLGPMLIGVYLNLILFGILIMQVYHDFQHYQSDSKWIKIFVSYLFIMETTNSVCDMAMMYQPLIAEWGTDKAITFFPTLFLMQPIVLVLISTPIQCFFAWRIKTITKSIWIPLIIVLFSLGSMGGGLCTGARIVILKLYVDKPQLNSTALIWFGCSCVSDIFIAILLVRSLSTRKTGFVATDSVVDKLVRMSLQTGMVTAVSAVGEIIFFMVSPHTSLNFVWDLALSKIYSNCLLSSLNARTAFKHTLAGTAERNIVFAERISYLPPTDSPNRQQSYELETGLTFQSKDEPYIARDARYNGIKITQVVERVGDSSVAV